MEGKKANPFREKLSGSRRAQAPGRTEAEESTVDRHTKNDKDLEYMIAKFTSTVIPNPAL